MNEEQYDKEFTLNDCAKSIDFVMNEKYTSCINLTGKFINKTESVVRNMYAGYNIIEISTDNYIRKKEEKTKYILEVRLENGTLTLQFNKDKQCIYALFYDER